MKAVEKEKAELKEKLTKQYSVKNQITNIQAKLDELGYDETTFYARSVKTRD